MLVSIHQLADAEKIADRVLLLARGAVAASGTLDALRARFGVSTLEEVFLRALEATDAGP